MKLYYMLALMVFMVKNMVGAEHPITYREEGDFYVLKMPSGEEEYVGIDEWRAHPARQALVAQQAALVQQQAKPAPAPVAGPIMVKLAVPQANPLAPSTMVQHEQVAMPAPVAGPSMPATVLAAEPAGQQQPAYQPTLMSALSLQTRAPSSSNEAGVKQPAQSKGFVDKAKGHLQSVASSAKAGLSTPLGKGVAIGTGVTAAVIGATAIGAGIASKVVKHKQAIKLDGSMFNDDGAYIVDLAYIPWTVLGAEKHYTFTMSLTKRNHAISLSDVRDEDHKSLSLPQSGITVHGDQIDVTRGFLCIKSITVTQVSGGSSHGASNKGGCGGYTFTVKKDGDKLKIERQ